MKQTIYDLELHESVYINNECCHVTRVASGWIYKYYEDRWNSSQNHWYTHLIQAVFVPFDNSFMKTTNTK